jgi:hypothetical protein
MFQPSRPVDPSLRSGQRLCGPPLRHESDRTIGAARDGHLDAQSRRFDVDLQPTDLLSQRCDVLIERAYLLARSGTLERGSATRSPALPLTRKVLLAHTLNDLTALLHAIQQLRL